MRALVGSAELIVLLGIVVLVVSALGSATDLRILKGFLISLAGAVALQVYSGTSGVLSFGHVGFIALGAYGSALFTASTDDQGGGDSRRAGLHPRRASSRFCRRS